MKVGFIGTGNMGSALAAAAAKADGVELLLSNRTRAKAEALAERLGGQVLEPKEAIEQADMIFIGVTPDQFRTLASEIKPYLDARKEKPLIVSMLAGTSIQDIKAGLGLDLHVIRIMPNFSVVVGDGLIMYDTSQDTSETDIKNYLEVMRAAGLSRRLPENLIPAGAGVGACGSAFMALVIEGLADGGVQAGLSRADALTFALQMMKGAASYMLETGIHPAELKDSVCTPGGTTIRGIKALEDAGVRSAFINSVIATVAYDSEL